MSKELVKSNATAGVAEPTVVAPETDMIYEPDADVLADGARIRVLVNIPGADQESVSATLENNVLTIAAQARVSRPDGNELVGQEYAVGKYRRAFRLPDSVNTDGVKATLKNGVLEVIIPKRDEVKARKVPIES